MRHLVRKLFANLNPVEHGVHFHPGPAGPYVCDNARCTSPGMDPREY